LVQFTVTILQFGKQGEKTGWTYIKIPAEIAHQLKPGQKKSFRVKGRLDRHSVHGLALIPMGNGDFILALNASIRKVIKKQKGDQIKVSLQADDQLLELSAELMDCLADEPNALQFFESLAISHRQYFSKWIESAKTEPTKTRRIAQTIIALSKRFHFGQMIRSLKADQDDLMKL
jgi:hypothetical protein